MFGTFDPLWAKSKAGRQLLTEHTEDVVAAVRRLRRIWHWLPIELEMAAQFHDMGKGAAGFQKMLRDDTPWNFRHEVLSAAIFRVCFDVEDLKWRAPYLALLTHHKNFGSANKTNPAFQRCKSELSPVWGQKWRELDVALLEKTFAAHLSRWFYDENVESPANDVDVLAYELCSVFRDLHTARIRGALVASDHLASAGLGVAFSGRTIFARRMKKVISARLERRKKEPGQYVRPWRGWSWMQRQCAHTSGSALLMAPTGAGKTEAALLWALNNRKGGERIFYVLPYQVSINAMAKRLGELFPDEQGQIKLGQNSNVAVVHANSDLAYLQESLNDELSHDEAAKLARTHKDAARQLYAPLKVTTVYQLLNLFFGRKFFEVGLLELSDSLVVFDEIHAYDGHTLGLILVLLDCLQKLGARVFIMTATLPDCLKNELREAAHIPASAEIALPLGDKLLQEARRQIAVHDGLIEDESIVSQIEAALASGLKVAIVCNTVRKAIRMSQLLERHGPYLVHSRFTLGDRAQRENQQRIEAQNLVIATQVIEVSLDVSFGVMWTELAPADALLQRFGRVNRHGDASPSAQVVICGGDDPGSQMVYDGEILATTAKWAREFEKSGERLTFDKSLAWMEAIYPHGLTPAENDAKSQAHRKFTSVVANLKPMIDPCIDPDLEVTLFDTVQVVPSRYEKEWREAVTNKQFLRAKELTVNVNLRSWFGADKKAQRDGLQGQRKITDLGDNWQMTVALFRYTNAPVGEGPCLGLDLDDPCDESDSNFC